MNGKNDEAETRSMEERIYVLGTGFIGCLLDAVLSMNYCRGTLIFRDELQVRKFEQAKNEIVFNRTYLPNSPKLNTKFKQSQ